MKYGPELLAIVCSSGVAVKRGSTELLLLIVADIRSRDGRVPVLKIILC